jgi:hypothetical protein
LVFGLWLSYLSEFLVIVICDIGFVALLELEILFLKLVSWLMGSVALALDILI